VEVFRDVLSGVPYEYKEDLSEVMAGIKIRSRDIICPECQCVVSREERLKILDRLQPELDRLASLSD
jgi:hypothetical protein